MSIPPSTISNMRPSPIAWYSMVATATREVPATNNLEGGGGIDTGFAAFIETQGDIFTIDSTQIGEARLARSQQQFIGQFRFP